MPSVTVVILCGAHGAFLAGPPENTIRHSVGESA